jgi:hypothetical protein
MNATEKSSCAPIDQIRKDNRTILIEHDFVIFFVRPREVGLRQADTVEGAGRRAENEK